MIPECFLPFWKRFSAADTLVRANNLHGDAVKAVLEHLGGIQDHSRLVFACQLLVHGIVQCQFQSDGQHVQAKHPHPARPVRLLDKATCGSSALRSKTPMLSNPKNPPSKTLFPNASL